MIDEAALHDLFDGFKFQIGDCVQLSVPLETCLVGFGASEIWQARQYGVILAQVFSRVPLGGDQVAFERAYLVQWWNGERRVEMEIGLTKLTVKKEPT